MLLHQFELTADERAQLQTDMDQLVRDDPVSWWSRLLRRVFWKTVPGYRILRVRRRRIPTAIRNRLMVLAYKYLDHIPGSKYRAPRSGVEYDDAVSMIHINATEAVPIASCVPMHRDNIAFMYDVVTVVFYVRKTLQGANLRVRLQGDCARVIPVSEGVAMAFCGDVLHGVTDGHGPGVRECFVVSLPRTADV
jgi:hypothetical protein